MASWAQPGSIDPIDLTTSLGTVTCLCSFLTPPSRFLRLLSGQARRDFAAFGKGAEAGRNFPEAPQKSLTVPDNTKA